MGASTAEIAIIGMSGRFPGAETLEDFWRNLRQGVESIGPVSEEELLASGVACSVFSRPDYVKVASTLPRIDRFDAELFGISQRVAEIMDPQQRLFLECAWAALEDAGYDPQRYPGAIGVFAGASPNTYLHHNLKGREDLAAAVGDAQLHFSNDGHYLATTTSYRLDLRGPSVNVQTACSTSLVAVHLAAQSLLLGECDIALAGGVCLRVPHRAGYLFLEGGIASPDGRCRPFDVRARGTVGGMGLGIVVLRRLSDAIEQQDSIRAVIRGSAINNDGARKIGFAAPSVDGQVRVISDALAVAEVPAASIQVIEAHGTATQLGDPLEVEALSQIFGGRERSLPPIALGSVKGNIGHLDVAAGVAGLIKVVLAMAAKEIPPSLHFERPNPELLLDRGPFLVQRALGPWNPGIGPRRAGVSSFGIGGTNAHVILQEPPPPESRVEPSGLPQLLCLSANSRSALQRAALRLADFFEQHPDTELADAAFTLQVGRRELRFRSSVMASSCDQAIRALRAISSGEPASAVQRDTPVILDLLEDSDRVAFEVLALVSEDADLRPILEHCIGLLGDHPAAALLLDGSGLARSLVAGPVARFVVAQSLAQLLVESGAQLDGLRGWGLGEVVAACLAGALPLKEGLWLAVQRGLSEHGPAELAAETHRQLLHRLSTSPLPSPQIRLAALRYGTEWLDRWLPSAGAPLAPVLAPKLGQIVFELGSRPEALKAGARCWLLKTLGRIWCSGAQVHWARLWRDRSVRRIALPTYPFEPQRFWIEPTRGDEDPRWSEVLAVGKRVASVHRPELEAEYSEKERWLHRLSVETMRSALWGLGLFRGSEVARSAEELARQGRVIPRYQQLLSDWLRLLTAEGYLRQAEGGFASARPWTPSALPHLIEQGRRAWANEPEWLETVVRCGAHLPEILTGARDALPSVLGSANKLGAEAAHASPLFRYFNQLIAAIGAQLAGMWSESGPMRALELGIGSGLTTAGLLPALGGRVQYTATDVNRAYLQQARTKFGQSPMIDFLLLDIERPPSEQGIASGGYHLVVAANVLHVTSDLRRALQHVREVLAPGGILLLWEITRPQAAFMATAGLLMNRLEDGARTQGNPFLSADEWSAALHGAGFDRIARFPDTDTLGYHVLLAQGSSAQVVVAPPARSEAAEVDDCFYLPSWRRAPLRPVRPDPASGEFPHIQVRGGRCWLIFLDPLGVGAALARGLERSGAPVFQIEAGGSLEQRGDRRFALRLTSTDDLDALLARLGEEGWIPDRVVHLWNVSTELPSAWSAENLVAYDALLALIQSMVRAAPGGGGHHVHLWVVSSSLQNVTGDEVIDPSRALLLGPVRVASQEHPNMVCRSVDLDPSPRDAGIERLAEQLLREVRAELPDQIVALRRGHRWVQGLVPIRLPRPTAIPCRLRERGTYLITGGLGGIALEIAEYLGRQLRAKLILVGRSGLPPRSDWDRWRATHPVEDPVVAALVRLQELEGLGAKVAVCAADVSRPDEMRAALAGALAQLGGGPIHGVFHAAGVPGGGVIVRQPIGAGPRDNLVPKVQGTVVLDQLLEDSPPDFILYCSSVNSLIGGFGHVDYCAANAFLDACAHLQGGRAISVNWDRWQGVGMARAVEDRHRALTGERLESGLSVAFALDALARVLDAGHPQVVVSARELSPESRRPRAVVDAALPKAAAPAPAPPEKRRYPRPELSNPFVAPETETERVVAEIWCEVLGVERVGAHDSFFELGGDSLVGLQIIDRLKQRLGKDVREVTLYEGPTVSSLSRLIESKGDSSALEMRSSRGQRRREQREQRGRDAPGEEP